MIRQYFEQNEVRKLHLGSDSHVLDGWLNVDWEPHGNPNILKADITQPFPFFNETFDYAYSEHTIEHLTYEKGQAMLRETYRAMKTGGRIRITTPDLGFLVEMYLNPDNELYKRYLEWATPLMMKWAPYNDQVFLFNNFVRDWGHVFIYDKKTLAKSLELAGFKNITEHKICESDDANLRDLENWPRMGKEFLQLESMTLEAVK
jgi:SAM-dependent methyltransferase